jgi:hypothetical protein
VYVVEGGDADLGGAESEEQWGRNAFYFGEAGTELVFNENEEFIPAYYNFWEDPDERSIYHADFIPYLDEDPLPKLALGGPPLASDFELAEAFPNPFNPTTIIRFNLAAPREVDVDIYNLLGQRIRSLYSGQVNTGTTSLVWDGANDSGRRVAAGLYLCQLRTTESHKNLKLTVLK